jgi:hypothetical protein
MMHSFAVESHRYLNVVATVQMDLNPAAPAVIADRALFVARRITVFNEDQHLVVETSQLHDLDLDVAEGMIGIG